MIDPSLFQKGEEMMFEASIIDAAWELEQAHEELKRREVPDHGAQTMAMYNELKEDEWREPDDYSGEDVLEQVFGEELESILGYVTSRPVKRINDQELRHQIGLVGSNLSTQGVKMTWEDMDNRLAVMHGPEPGPEHQ